MKLGKAVVWAAVLTAIASTVRAESPGAEPKAYLSQYEAKASADPASPASIAAAMGPGSAVAGPTTYAGLMQASAVQAAPPGAAGPQIGVIPTPDADDFGARFRNFFRRDQCLPRWYFQADAIGMMREDSESLVVASVNPPPYQVPTTTVTTTTNSQGQTTTVATTVFTTVDPPAYTALSTEDLNFDFKAAPRLLLGFVVNKAYQVEFSYYDLNEWDTSAFVRDETTFDSNPTGVPAIFEGPLRSPFSDYGADVLVPGFMLDNNIFFEIGYFSDFKNFELNFRHQLPMPPIPLAVSFLWGFRYLGLEEQFTYYSESVNEVPGTVDIVTDTDNDVLGFQIGAMFQLGIDPGWWTEFEIKGGIGNNSASSNVDYVHAYGPGGGTVDSGILTADEDHTAYFGDLRWSLVYQFGPHLTTHIGYQATGLEGMALAYRNMPTNAAVLANDGPAELEHKGDLFYHGPFAGLTAAW